MSTIITNNVHTDDQTIQKTSVNKAGIVCTYSLRGKLLHGKCNGIGTEEVKNGNYQHKYIGEFSDNKHQGHGELSKAKYQYKGMFYFGKMHGCGEYTDNETDNVYIGIFVHGHFPSECEIQYPNGNIYKGTIKGMKRHGQGIETYKVNGFVYTYMGDFVNDKKTGKCHTTSQMYSYRGDIRDGKPHGNGILTDSAEELTYDGGFEDGKFHGHGDLKCYSPNNRFKCSRYIGGFSLGKFSGYGNFINYDQIETYVGDFAHGLPEGDGRQRLIKRNSNGNAYTDIFDGEFANGKRNGMGRLEFNQITPSGVEEYYIKGYFEDDQFINGEIERKLSNCNYHYKGECAYRRLAAPISDYRLELPSFHGLGTLTSPTGNSYKGNFDHSVFQGHGIVTLMAGDQVYATYESEFTDNCAQDTVSVKFQDGDEATVKALGGYIHHLNQYVDYAVVMHYPSNIRSPQQSIDSLSPLVVPTSPRPSARGRSRIGWEASFMSDDTDSDNDYVDSDDDYVEDAEYNSGAPIPEDYVEDADNTDNISNINGNYADDSVDIDADGNRMEPIVTNITITPAVYQGSEETKESEEPPRLFPKCIACITSIADRVTNCGHIVVCEECSINCTENGIFRCPACRFQILSSKLIRLFA